MDETTLVPDESLSIDEGAVAPWNTLMWSLMTDVCRAMGVRTDVPFRDLTAQEREIVFHGPAVMKHIFYTPKNGAAGEFRRAVARALQEGTRARTSGGAARRGSDVGGR